jgi:hypothetical protein
MTAACDTETVLKPTSIYSNTPGRRKRYPAGRLCGL